MTARSGFATLFLLASATVAIEARAMDVHHDTGTRPAALGEAVERELARARAETVRFKDVQTALGAGYLATDVCVAHPAHGVMGFHYKNPPLRDAIVDAERPEILLYIRAPDGAMKLTGVEYVVPLDVWTRNEPPVVFGQVMRRDDDLKIWYLHAWLWETNEAGIFSDWNPSLKC